MYKRQWMEVCGSGKLTKEDVKEMLDLEPRLVRRYDIDASQVPPVVWAVFATSLSRVLVMETALGMSTGHAETLEFVEAWLRQLEGEPVEAATAVTTGRV